MERSGEHAAVPTGRTGRYRRDGQGRVQREQHTGTGNAECDGQGHGRARRLPSGVRGRTSRGGLRVVAHGQRIAVQVTDE